MKHPPFKYKNSSLIEQVWRFICVIPAQGRDEEIGGSLWLAGQPVLAFLVSCRLMRECLKSQVTSTWGVKCEVTLWALCTHVFTQTHDVYTHTHTQLFLTWLNLIFEALKSPSSCVTSPVTCCILARTFYWSLTSVLLVNFPWSLPRHPVLSLCSYFSIFKILNSCFHGTSCHVFIQQRKGLLFL